MLLISSTRQKRLVLFEYFDVNGNSLGSFEAPTADNGLSFLGVVFEDAIVARVEVKYDTSALGSDGGAGVLM